MANDFGPNWNDDEMNAHMGNLSDQAGGSRMMYPNFGTLRNAEKGDNRKGDTSSAPSYIGQLGTPAAGVHRPNDVLVLEKKATSAKDVPKQMTEFVQWANANETNDDIAHFAAQVHHKLSTIHLFICGDCCLAVFDFLTPSQLGLGIALVNRRFDCIVDKHFKVRKWTIKQMQIVNSDENPVPIPQNPLPKKVIGFRGIQIFDIAIAL
ncbi:hypothetical protein niasHS_005180 [Heterodera schachtii]|uniref:Fido domain-containing protein n=1 Tax=Heterodera schachtii TaxID=97005 RepID=A0ABD2JRM4_HETSC